MRVGDPIIVISPASLGARHGAPRLERFVVGGFFYSGMYDFDSTLIFVSLKDGPRPARRRSAARKRPRGAGAQPVRRSRDRRQIARIAGPGFTVKDWTTDNAALFSALKLEKFTYFLVLMLIVLVAAFNIVATLVMVVMERRKEIAILRAMGARAGSVAAIFLSEGAALGVVGTAIGVGAGFRDLVARSASTI